MLSLQLALKEINDDNITIYPRDSGFNDKQKFLSAVESLRQENVKIVIGPTNFNNFNYLNNYRDMIFISPSNTNPKVQDNVLSIGVSLESQIKAIEKFLIKNEKKKTIIMFPRNKFENLVESGGVAKSVISDGLVKVNGSVETRKRKKIISGDVIVFNGEKLCVSFTMNKGN